MKKLSKFKLFSFFALFLMWGGMINNVSAGNIKTQEISFGDLSNKIYGDADFTVSATASSGLPVDFNAFGNCTVSGNTVHIVLGLFMEAGDNVLVEFK